MNVGVHLLVPVKPLDLAKSRLVGATGEDRRGAAHADLVVALALDTVTAARQAPGVAAVSVVTSDSRLSRLLAAVGVAVLPDVPGSGLNPALRHADALLRDRGVARIGALQADLPALRAVELGLALDTAGNRRAFCPDRPGTGTTLLLAEPGKPLDPRFGPDSASAHQTSGAMPLLGAWESLRCDVDTAEDLAHAARLGLGAHTTPHWTRAFSRTATDR